MTDPLHLGAAIAIVYALRRSASEPWLPLIPGGPPYVRHGSDAGALATAIRDAWPPPDTLTAQPIGVPVNLWSTLAGADYDAQALSYATVGAIPAGDATAPA